MEEPLLCVLAESLWALLSVQLLKLLKNVDVRGRIDGDALGDEVLVEKNKLTIIIQICNF